MEIATKRLIDDVWVLEFEFVDSNKIKIYNITRKLGNLDVGLGEEFSVFDLEKKHQRYQCEEDEERTVTHVYLGDYEAHKSWADKNSDKKYEVVNPQHIFSYSE